MPIFDVSRIRRTGWASVDELADELATVLDAANKGISAPLVINCVGDEPAIKAMMPDADLTTIPVIQVRSGRELFEIPAWPSTHDPVPIPAVSGEPAFTEYPNPPPWGQAPPDIDRTSGATAGSPQEAGWWQPPMPALGKVVSGSAPNWVCDVFLSDPLGDPYMRLTAVDLNNSLALSASDWVDLTLVFPADLYGGCVAYIAQP